MMLPLALLMFGLGGPVKSVKCIQPPAVDLRNAAHAVVVNVAQVCTVALRKPAMDGDRITLIHSAKDPTASASTMWEFGKNGQPAGVTSVDLYESPQTEVVGVRYDGRGSTKAVK